MVKNLLLLLLCPCLLLAEGTKELRPNESHHGNLVLYNQGGFTEFGMYDAPVENRIKIRIGSLDEKIYIGLNNKQGLHIPLDDGPFVPNVPFRIRTPSDVTIYESVIPAPGEEGHVATYEQAVAGPVELGNPDGFDAIMLDNLPETGDYYIEFNPDPMLVNGEWMIRLNIHLFDITVADANNNPIPGRLHSQAWQITTERFDNGFWGKMYPYDGGSAVYEVDFNGMEPFVFVVVLNSVGTDYTGDFLEDRKSKIGNYMLPEFEVFLNPPDESLYPVNPVFAEMSAEVKRVECTTTEYCMEFTTSTGGYISGFIDFNNNGVYDAGIGEVYFGEHYPDGGQNCIEWDGNDSFGNPVDDGQYRVIASFGFGITHKPLYDVEHNRNGYKVNIIRPENSEPPLLFWDDEYIVDGNTLGDPLVNLSGCLSVETGCHRWEYRGAIDDESAYYRQETINTWWYSDLVLDTVLFNVEDCYDCGIEFPNAFSPNGDGINDDIGILGYAPKVELKIFNRWGEVIFRTFEIEKRWDGIYRGVEAPVGVYPFILDWECPDENGNMVKHQRVGDVTLVR
ncbi:gliding motility-associated C-terminal domain-containing protein [Cytophagaceae bacterium ABcell3]|nr:gliding motility-associated C-terminal domain-containing protein [Cytophagaceae bacterium ABcell3]